MLSTFIPMASSWWMSSSTFLQAAALRKAGPAPHLVSKAELTLLIGVGVNQPKKMSLRDLVPSFICHTVAWMEERSPLFQPAIPEAGGRAGPEVVRTGELPLLLPSLALGRAGFAPCLGSMIEQLGW